MRSGTRRLLNRRVAALLVAALLLALPPVAGAQQDAATLLLESDVAVADPAMARGLNLGALRDSVLVLREREGVQVKYLIIRGVSGDLATYMKRLRSELAFDGVLVVITPEEVGASATLEDDQIVATLRAEGGEAEDPVEMAVKSAERLVSQQQGADGRSLLRIAIIGLICVLPLWLIWYFRSTPRFGDDPSALNIDASGGKKGKRRD